MSETDQSVQLITEVLKTHQKIGLDKTIKYLIEARMDPKHFKELIEQKILSFVSTVFEIPVEDLRYGTSKGNRTDALMIVYILFQKHLDYRFDKIGNVLDKDKSVISKSISTFNRLKTDNKHEAILLKKYCEANNMIIEFIALETEKQKQDGTTDINS